MFGECVKIVIVQSVRVVARGTRAARKYISKSLKMCRKGSEGQMFGISHHDKSSGKPCAAMESKLIEYLDGRTCPEERRAVEEHLSACASCKARAEEFRALWSTL